MPSSSPAFFFKSSAEMQELNQRRITQIANAEVKISVELYQQANAIYQKMIVEVRALLGIDKSEEFGKTVVAPSQLIERLYGLYESKTEMLLMLIGSILDKQTHQVIAFSVDRQGQPISEKELRAELGKLKEKFNLDFSTLENLIENTSKAIADLASDWSQKPGNPPISAGDIYLDINRRAIAAGTHVSLSDINENDVRQIRAKV